MLINQEGILQKRKLKATKKLGLILHFSELWYGSSYE